MNTSVRRLRSSDDLQRTVAIQVEAHEQGQIKFRQPVAGNDGELRHVVRSYQMYSANRGSSSRRGQLLRIEKSGNEVLDLKDVTLVGQDGVTFLAECEEAHIMLAYCPQYVREWITRQRSGE